MPRLSPQFLRSAHNRNPLLSLLLRACRDLPSARSELCWLRDHVNILLSLNQPRSHPHSKTTYLHKLCLQRSHQKPIQYILGDTPFGDLFIQCRPGVLIPRWETAEYTTYLAHLLIANPKVARSKPLRILDLCTGTGCIPLLLHSLLHPHFRQLEFLGVDISPKAIVLAQQNLESNIISGHLQPEAREQVRFGRGDIFSDDFLHSVSSNGERWDILISNPPYISPRAFHRTSRSVRNWEPIAALVPPHKRASLDPGNQDNIIGAKTNHFRFPRPLHIASNIAKIDTVNDEKIGDAFYPRLLHIAKEIRAKIALLEVADMEQAMRVVGMVESQDVWEGCEIWRDLPAKYGHDSAVEVEGIEGVVRGRGNGRSVMMWMEDGRDIVLQRKNDN